MRNYHIGYRGENSIYISKISEHAGVGFQIFKFIGMSLLGAFWLSFQLIFFWSAEKPL